MTVAGPVEEAEIEEKEPAPCEAAEEAPEDQLRRGSARASYSSRRRSSLLALVVGYPIVKAIYPVVPHRPGLDAATGSSTRAASGTASRTTSTGCSNSAPRHGGGTEHCPPGLLGAEFWSSVWVTLLFAFVTVVLETVIGMGFALMMNRAFRGRAIVRAVILIPWAIPTAVTSKLWFVIFDPQGILNTCSARTSSGPRSRRPPEWRSSSPTRGRRRRSSRCSSSPGCRASAPTSTSRRRLDGASAWQRFTRITLPLVKPALAVAVIFRALDALRMYDLPAILTHGANGTTTLSMLVVQRLLDAGAELGLGTVDDHVHPDLRDLAAASSGCSTRTSSARRSRPRRRSSHGDRSRHPGRRRPPASRYRAVEGPVQVGQRRHRRRARVHRAVVPVAVLLDGRRGLPRQRLHLRQHVLVHPRHLEQLLLRVRHDEQQVRSVAGQQPDHRHLRHAAGDGDRRLRRLRAGPAGVPRQGFRARGDPRLVDVPRRRDPDADLPAVRRTGAGWAPTRA